MTADSAFAGLRHVRAVERRQSEVLRRATAAAAPKPWLRRLGDAALCATLLAALPACVVYAAARAAAEAPPSSGADAVAGPFAFWGVLAAIAVLLGSGHRFQWSALVFAPEVVLRLPGKAAVLLHRLAAALPWQLFAGASWALAVLLRLGSAPAASVATTATLTAVALLAPFAWNLGRLLQRLTGAGASSTLGPAIVVAAAAGYGLDPARWRSGDAVAQLFAGFALVLGVLALAGLALAWRRPAQAWRGLWPELVRLPRLAVLAVLIAPTWALDRGLTVTLAAVAAASLLLLPFALRQLLAQVAVAEAETAQTGIVQRAQSARPAAAPAAAPRPLAAPRKWARARHRGRSPARAAWRLFWLQRGWAGPVWLLVLVGMLSLQLARLSPPQPWLPTRGALDAFALFALAGLLAPSGLETRPSRRGWLWGVDWRDQGLLRLRAVLWAAIPLLAAGLAAATWLGWNERRALAIGTCAAALLLRAGWRGLHHDGERAHFGGGLFLLVLGLLVATATLPIVQPASLVAACAVGLVGLWRRLARLREPELAAAAAAAFERGDED